MEHFYEVECNKMGDMVLGSFGLNAIEESIALMTSSRSCYG